MFGIDDVIGVGLKIIDKFIPDPAEKLKAQQALQQMQHDELMAFLDADKAVAAAQAATNTEEAKSSSLFVAGWRPSVGWVCSAAFAYNFVIQPFLLFIFAAGGRNVVIPALDMGVLLTLLLGMLGLGGMRSYDKKNGVAR